MQALDLTKRLLQPAAAATVAAGLPAPTTLRKYTAIEDLHELQEIKTLIEKSNSYVYCNDSGAKDSNEHHAQLVCLYLSEEDVVARFVVDVGPLGSTTGAAYDKSKAQTFAELGIDERLETEHASDTCSSIVGINRAHPEQSKGMNALTSIRTGNFFTLVAECASHGEDLVLRAGMLSFCGRTNKW
jgi:hypothetical protein